MLAIRPPKSRALHSPGPLAASTTPSRPRCQKRFSSARCSMTRSPPPISRREQNAPLNEAPKDGLVYAAFDESSKNTTVIHRHHTFTKHARTLNWQQQTKLKLELKRRDSPPAFPRRPLTRLQTKHSDGASKSHFLREAFEKGETTALLRFPGLHIQSSPSDRATTTTERRPWVCAKIHHTKLCSLKNALPFVRLGSFQRRSSEGGAPLALACNAIHTSD